VVQDCLLEALEVLVLTWVVEVWEGVEVEEAEQAESTVVVTGREVALEWVQACGAQDMVPHPMLRELTPPNVMSRVLAGHPE